MKQHGTASTTAAVNGCTTAPRWHEKQAAPVLLRRSLTRPRLPPASAASTPQRVLVPSVSESRRESLQHLGPVEGPKLLAQFRRPLALDGRALLPRPPVHVLLRQVQQPCQRDGARVGVGGQVGGWYRISMLRCGDVARWVCMLHKHNNFCSPSDSRGSPSPPNSPPPTHAFLPNLSSKLRAPGCSQTTETYHQPHSSLRCVRCVKNAKDAPAH